MEIVNNIMREELADHIGKHDIKIIVKSIDAKSIEMLYSLLFDEDKRVSDNAAWVLTHIPLNQRQNLNQHHDEMIDEALRTTSVTKQRLIMRLLDDQEFPAEEVRTDFLDFCLERIVDSDASCGVRSLAIKLAYKQCLHYPELLQELRETLEILDADTLSRGLAHARNKALQTIKKQ